MPRYSPPPPPLSSSSACSSPEHNLFGSWRARESKIGHLNSPVIAIILPAWKIYARGCYSCAIVRFHSEGGEKSRHRNPSTVGTEIYGRRLNGGGRWKRRCDQVRSLDSWADFGITRWTGRDERAAGVVAWRRGIAERALECCVGAFLRVAAMRHTRESRARKEGTRGWTAGGEEETRGKEMIPPPPPSLPRSFLSSLVTRESRERTCRRTMPGIQAEGWAEN